MPSNNLSAMANVLPSNLSLPNPSTFSRKIKCNFSIGCCGSKLTPRVTRGTLTSPDA